MGYRQIIIARKDLSMCAGKLAAQVSHASMAFLTNMIKNNSLPFSDKNTLALLTETKLYKSYLEFDKDLYEQWINGIFTKTVCEAKNKNHLLKAITIAKDLGLKEGEDFFLIKDCCLTELEPEEIDKNGIGRTLTCIGFKPLPDEIAHQISKKYQLYK